MIFSADDAALILDVADAAAHWGDYLEDQDRTEELLILDEQLLAVHVLVKRLGQELPILLEAYEALAASRLNAGVIVCWGHCDTCGEPCDSEGCTVDRNHEIALD